jgi:hypothetical protein
LQSEFPEVPAVTFNALPWILMILVLFLAGSNVLDRLVNLMPERWQPRLRRLLRVQPPMALGTTFEEG